MVLDHQQRREPRSDRGIRQRQYVARLAVLDGGDSVIEGGDWMSVQSHLRSAYACGVLNAVKYGTKNDKKISVNQGVGSEVCVGATNEDLS